MSAFKRTLLYGAIITAQTSIGSAIASSAFDSFIDDTTVDGKLRTVYYDVHNKEKDRLGEEKNTAGAWTGGLWVNMRSGYLADIFAFGGSFYGVTKLHMKDDNADSYQLLIDDYHETGVSEGYGKIGQAWVDLKLPGSIKNTSGHIQAGRQRVYTGLISSSGSRSAESTWRGYKLEGSTYGLDFGFAYVDQMSLRNQSGFHDLTDFSDSPKQIEHIMGGELAYTFQLAEKRTLKLKYRTALSKDFLQAHNGDIEFKTPLSDRVGLTLGGKYYHTKKDGDLWSGKAWGKPAFDEEANAYNFHAALGVGSWNFRAAVSHIDAKYTHPTSATGHKRPGAYYYDFGKNTHGIWDLGTSGFAEDMMYDNETVWMAGVTYDFSHLGLKGLELGYAFHYGSGMEVIDPSGNKKSTSEYENDFHIIYAFPQPKVKGLKLKVEYGIYRNDEELRKAIKKEEDDLRVWLDYTFTLF